MYSFFYTDLDSVDKNVSHQSTCALLLTIFGQLSSDIQPFCTYTDSYPVDSPSRQLTIMHAETAAKKPFRYED